MGISSGHRVVWGDRLSKNEGVNGGEMAFPAGLRGLKEAELRMPIVRLLLPADHRSEVPPFLLPGRARWEILQEGAFPHSEEEVEHNTYTFIFWSVASSYLKWVSALLDMSASRSDVVVILHAGGEVVPRYIAHQRALKVDHQGRLYEALFRLISAMVLPAVLQSVMGADPADIRRLSRNGGTLHVDFVEASDVESLWAGIERCWESCSFPQGRLTGLVFAIMAPIGMPIMTSSGLLDGDRWERLLPDDDIDLMVTLFSREDEMVSATLLRFLR